MPEEGTIAQLNSSLAEGSSFMVVLPPNPSVDELAAASALHQTMQNAGKNVRLVSPRVPQVLEDIDEQIFPNQNQIGQELGNENLTISFAYSEDQVDKVSYHIGEETSKFHLTIKPKSGAAPLDANTVEFSYTGASADLIFLVGVTSLESLEQLYFGYEDVYQNTPIANISLSNSSLGTLPINPDHHSSLSELVATMLHQMNLEINREVATTLLYGIDHFSHHLSAPETEPETFEIVAILLRLGAKRVLKPAGGAPNAGQVKQQSFGEALRSSSQSREVQIVGGEDRKSFQQPDEKQTEEKQPEEKRRRRRRRKQPRQQADN